MERIQIRTARSTPDPRWRASVFLRGAFRPFFLLAGVYACAPLIAWLVLYARGVPLWGRWPAMTWHGHEMVFGFAAAAIAGFLLTAVPKWTGTAPISRRTLALLVGAWLLGRMTMWTSAWLPAWWVAAANVLLLAAMGALVARAVYGTGNRRNYAFPVLLFGLCAANAVTHLDPGGARGRVALGLAVAVFVLAIVIVGGRIVPLFTWGALEHEGVDVRRRPRRWLRVTSLLACGVALVADFGLSLGRWAGYLELVAGVAVLAQMAGWYGHRTLRRPILWVLHLGWLWLGVAFLLRGAGHLGLVSLASGLHAFTAGAIGTMVIAVMSRAALGHTGRPLEIDRVTTAAYALVALGAALRVFGPIVAPDHTSRLVIAGGVTWTLGFALFVAAYLPILGKPRVDGMPG